MTTAILNDNHIGAVRQAGTTLQSREDLRQHLVDQFDSLVTGITDYTLFIGGDLFDKFHIEERDLIATFTTLSNWIKRTGGQLVLGGGNHDSSIKASLISSFELLYFMLNSLHPGNVQMINADRGFTQVVDDLYAIPHCHNQDLLNLEIQKALDEEGQGRVLHFHANYDNHFATQSDHSLNVSEEQAKALIEAGWTLVFAHEHQARTALDGKVIVVGNQTSSSISDCLGNDFKQYLRILGPGQFEFVKTEDTKSIYQKIDWTQVGQDTIRDDAKFIRVTGKATSEQAADAVNVVAGVRKVSNAFVVSNSITIEGIQDFDNLSDATFEDVSKVDVLDLLLSEFDENEQSIIKGLLRD